MSQNIIFQGYQYLQLQKIYYGINHVITKVQQKALYQGKPQSHLVTVQKKQHTMELLGLLKDIKYLFHRRWQLSPPIFSSWGYIIFQHTL